MLICKRSKKNCTGIFVLFSSRQKVRWKKTAAFEASFVFLAMLTIAKTILWISKQNEFDIDAIPKDSTGSINKVQKMRNILQIVKACQLLMFCI